MSALLLLVLALLHPLHTSHVDLTETAPGAVTLRIRVFSDDLAAMTGPGVPRDSVLARYVRRTVAVTTASGAPVAFRWQGAAADGDVTYLTAATTIPGGLAGASLHVALGADHFPDQVNVVRARYGARAVNLLFLPGDGPRRLP